MVNITTTAISSKGYGPSSFSILLKKNCFSVKLLQSFSFFVCVNVSEAVSLVTLFVATSFH